MDDPGMKPMDDIRMKAALKEAFKDFESDLAFIRKYISTLESFIGAVASALGCLPSYADPRPDGGNAHIMAKLTTLLEDKKKLEEVLGSFLRAPHIGSDGPGSSTIVVQEFNLKAARVLLPHLDAEQNGGGK